MRKFTFVLSILMLTSCANSEASKANQPQIEQINESHISETGETTESEELVITQKEYTAEELEQMRLNVGLSVTDNSINLKSMYAGRMLYVPETDTLFYMQDDKLYQKNGDKTIVLADIPAISLTLHDGKLYFIYALERNIYYEYHKRWGAICCLDLSTGQVSRVLNVDNVIKFFLDGNILYYTIAEEIETKATVPTKTYKVDMKTQQMELVEEFSHQAQYAISTKYNVFTDYSKDPNSGEVSVEFQITDKSTGKVKTYTENKWPDRLSIYDDTIYYIYGSKLRALNIDDMSVTEYTANNPWESNTPYIGTYIIHKGKLIVTTGSDIQIWSEELGEWDYYCPLLDSSVSTLTGYSELFSDGENLYVLNGGREWLYIDIADLGYDLILPDGDTIIDDQITVRPLGDEE